MSQYKRMVDASYSRVVAELAEMKHDLAEAREKLAEREATVDILVQRVHERDAELGELKRSGKTERGFTNDYIKALHKAERERDEARRLRQEEYAIATARLQQALDAATTLARERDEAIAFIEREGYRRCDIPACNCNSWHGGHANDRLESVLAERDEWRASAAGYGSDAEQYKHERDEARALLREATSDRCVVCHADLQPSMTVPPHCEDCIADDDACCDHEDRVNDFRARLDAVLGKGGVW